MITYELAKKLKEAGFMKKKILSKSNLIASTEDNEFYYIPTLSELIEACGDALYELRRLNQNYHSIPIDGRLWEASSPKVIPMIYLGFTPEEAVANLWLELNKK